MCWGLGCGVSLAEALLATLLLPHRVARRLLTRGVLALLLLQLLRKLSVHLVG